MSGHLAAIIGGAAGAVAMVGIVIVICFCISHKRTITRTSETGSSDPSVQGKFCTIYVYSRVSKRQFNVKNNQLTVFYDNLQWEDMLGLSCPYEKQGALRWKNCLLPQKISVIKI